MMLSSAKFCIDEGQERDCRMITQEEFNDKVVKLMAMAGTEGGSYSLWSVNQIVHGLREAVPGTTADKVKTALETLVSDGTVKERLPSREKDPMQYVLSNKMPAPEPLNPSPVVVHRGVGGDEDDPGRTTVPLGSKASVHDRLKNVEEVMSDLNNMMSSTKEKNKELWGQFGKVRGEIEDSNSEIRSLKSRIRGVEEDVKSLVETIMSSANGPNKKDSLRKTNDSVPIASILKMSNRWDDDASDLESNERQFSSPEWARVEGKVEVLRQCAREVRRLLEKVGDGGCVSLTAS